jgi:uncharacterized protein YdhG (YjbR/CyaY superfamily)
MKNYKNITDYIKSFDKSSQKLLKDFRLMVRELAPKGVEAIRYGMPTLQIDGKNVLHYAAMKNHFGFYPTPSGIEAFKSELEKLGIDYSKGCIRFPYRKPLPITLIKKIVKFRLKEEKNIN